MATHHLGGGDVADVEVRSFAEAVRLATARPATTEQAQYSLPFPLAAMIVRGRIGADEITGEGLHDAAVFDLSSRIRLVEDPAICARFPAERFAVVTLTTKDGRTLRSDWVEAHGGPANPLSDEEMFTKFRTLTNHLDEGRRVGIEQRVAGFGRDEPQAIAPFLDLILAPL
jgi:2-methylcitrate dehydratase PrpD